ncbi:MAG TPA: hypothetical protein VJ571_03670 [Candidatus Nitrosotalea sp.]|nr:hypothetical protein [Candidatus Nitrosotalea sp.]
MSETILEEFSWFDAIFLDSVLEDMSLQKSFLDSRDCPEHIIKCDKHLWR